MGRPVPGKKLELVRADPVQPSFRMYHYADPAAKHPSLGLGEVNWSVDKLLANDDGVWSITFATTVLGQSDLKIRKTYRLGKGDYHLGLSLEIVDTRTEGKEKRKFRYQLTGAHGLPIEGEWYTNPGYMHNSMIGIVDSAGTLYRSFEDANRIAVKEGGDRVDRASGYFQYAAVVNQYFASAIVVDPEQTWGDWKQLRMIEWARPTSRNDRNQVDLRRVDRPRGSQRHPAGEFPDRGQGNGCPSPAACGPARRCARAEAAAAVRSRSVHGSRDEEDDRRLDAEGGCAASVLRRHHGPLSERCAGGKPRRDDHAQVPALSRPGQDPAPRPVPGGRRGRSEAGREIHVRPQPADAHRLSLRGMARRDLCEHRLDHVADLLHEPDAFAPLLAPLRVRKFAGIVGLVDPPAHDRGPRGHVPDQPPASAHEPEDAGARPGDEEAPGEVQGRQHGQGPGDVRALPQAQDHSDGGRLLPALLADADLPRPLLCAAGKRAVPARRSGSGWTTWPPPTCSSTGANGTCRSSTG